MLKKLHNYWVSQSDTFADLWQHFIERGPASLAHGNRGRFSTRGYPYAEYVCRPKTDLSIGPSPPTMETPCQSSIAPIIYR